MSHLFGCMDCPRPRSRFGTWMNLESDMERFAVNICLAHFVVNIWPWTFCRWIFCRDECQNICPSSAKSICRFSVCHWVFSQGSMANRKIAYTLSRGRAYMFDMSSTSGYMGDKYSRSLVPYFLTCPQLVGTWVQKMFRNLVPDFWHVPWASEDGGTSIGLSLHAINEP